MQNIGNQYSVPTAIRDLWYNYRSEIFFFLILSTCVALSTYLSRFLPDEVFDNTITPILITATVVTSFLGAWVLFRHPGGIKARRLFAWALVVWGLSDLVYLLGWATAPKQIMDMGAVELTDYELLLGNLLGWVMLLYPTEALRPGWLTWKTAAWQLLPMFALVGLNYLIPLNLSPIIACYPYVLLAFLLTHMRAYQRWCEENYSTLDDIDVRWLIRYSSMLFLVGVNYVYMCYSDAPTRGFTQQWFVVFMMAYSIEQILFRKDPWVVGVEVKSEDLNSSKDDQPSNGTASKREVEQLARWMSEAKPYLSPDFQLMDLRQVLPMNRTYLSRFLRDEFGCTFYQFVNRYRIDEAKRLLIEQPELKMADVAARSGFSSRTAFLNTFTREVGMSPTDWCKNCHPA